ncbi:MAG TPA: MarR family winged helix-turn-helix transcriptional regulator [Pusillimonas sp.]|uniref:MarR family winged helix-turn-helix transcriptional regulator n=1 Tax=unclassified Pusillimonas TaxID=2640016 RepID=UPI0026304E60|nr:MULTISPECIES: MarR family winged helix-turn-helix transcriptional regulator [unclassified Pusillimonas]HLU19885.1 MarR family winged helix-turn-helix transcriptional regulator [Pusillimonas sp.]
MRKPSLTRPASRKRIAATTKKPEIEQPDAKPWLSSAIDLEHYAPAYFTFITTKLAGGAASVYRKHFGVGIEVWRVLVMLALDEKVSVNMVCRLIGMDKGSVSRAFKSMYEMGLIKFSHDPKDGRVRYATLTEAGRRKHDEIKAVAMTRERAFLSCLEPEEVPVLLEMLWRLHANLPEVEKATQAFLKSQCAPASKPARKRKKENS